MIVKCVVNHVCAIIRGIKQNAGWRHLLRWCVWVIITLPVFIHIIVGSGWFIWHGFYSFIASEEWYGIYECDIPRVTQLQYQKPTEDDQV